VKDFYEFSEIEVNPRYSIEPTLRFIVVFLPEYRLAKTYPLKLDLSEIMRK